MTVLAANKRSLVDVVLGEPLELAKSQPHQVLLSAGSVAIMAQFAAHGGIVEWWIGYCIAIGVEWAYLRGLAYDGQAPTWWGSALNWSAFGIVVLWGVLWVSTIYEAIPKKPGGIGAVLLAIAHVVPIAWLALCSAMCHRAAARATHEAAERHEVESLARERQRAEEEAAWERGQQEKDRDLERWKDAQRLKVELRTVEKSVTPALPVTPVTESSQGVTTPSREAQRAVVVAAYKTHGEKLNVTQEAKKLGVSRGMWYKLRDEARSLGELPTG